MFKKLILAAYVAVSFVGASLTSAIPAAADDDYDACTWGEHIRAAAPRRFETGAPARPLLQLRL
jgi:hypothetical protein